MIGRDDVPLLADEPAIDALARLSESKINRGFVLDDRRLIGILSITDLVRALEVKPRPRRLATRGRPAQG